MIKQTPLNRIMSVVHITFFSSLLCFGTICLSGTVLLLPALGASFLIGKDVLYKRLDINDSIIKIYFRYLANSIKLVKYLAVNIIAALNIAGMIVAARTDNFIYSAACLAIAAFLFAFMFYIAGYHAFVCNKINIIEVAAGMFTKPYLLITVFAAMVLCVLFFTGTLMAVLFVSGALLIFGLEIPVFIQMLRLKKILGRIDSNEKYAYPAD
ncbi:MAG TPA: hypothetical protein VIL89_00845 [Clostridia bacterium]